MNFDTARAVIRSQLQRMNALYLRPVFDEWVILSLTPSRAVILAYDGPRPDHYKQTFQDDVVPLRTEMTQREHAVGDFEFALEAVGAHYDAFMRLGDAAYLVCNNTAKTMADIRRDPQWLKAQAAWFELGEKFRADPLE